jgi:hypothetical protein
VPSQIVGPAGEIETLAFCAFAVVVKIITIATRHLRVNDFVIK